MKSDYSTRSHTTHFRKFHQRRSRSVSRSLCRLPPPRGPRARPVPPASSPPPHLSRPPRGARAARRSLRRAPGGASGAAQRRRRTAGGVPPRGAGAPSPPPPLAATTHHRARCASQATLCRADGRAAAGRARPLRLGASAHLFGGRFAFWVRAPQSNFSPSAPPQRAAACKAGARETYYAAPAVTARGGGHARWAQGAQEPQTKGVPAMSAGTNPNKGARGGVVSRLAREPGTHVRRHSPRPSHRPPRPTARSLGRAGGWRGGKAF